MSTLSGIYLFFLLSFFLLSQVLAKNICETETELLLTAKARGYAERAQNARHDWEQIQLAKEGIKMAEECVHQFPEQAACYFYRAVNTGLSIKKAPLGYQKKLKSMVDDAQKVIELDPGLESGGAYRILGNIYLKGPMLALSKKSILKDLDKAAFYSEHAMQKNPLYFENRLLQAHIFYEQEKWQPSQALFLLVTEELARKKKTLVYEEALKEAKAMLIKLEKKLTKRGH